ncbi:MAG: mechanosensitive ion channel domain-containing protein [Planctomycetota bacterium]
MTGISGLDEAMHRARYNWMRFLFALCLGLYLTNRAHAQVEQDVPTPGATLSEELATAAEIEASITALEALEAPADDAAQQLELLRQALRYRLDIDRIPERTAELRAAAADAPAELAEISQQLALPPASAPTGDGLTIEELKALITSARSRLEARRQARDQLERAPVTRAERRAAIADEQTALQTRLQQLSVASTTEAESGDSVDIAVARQLAKAAERQSLVLRQGQLTAEFENLEARRELFRAQRQLAERHFLESTEEVASLDAALALMQASETELLIRAAEDAVDDAIALNDPLVLEVARANLRLADEAEMIIALTETRSLERTELTDLSEHWSSEFRRMEEKVLQAGFSDAIGITLRRHRSELPDIRRHRRQLNERRGDMNDAQFRRTELESREVSLVDLDAVVTELFDSEIGGPEGQSRNERRPALIAGLREQRDVFLPQAIGIYDRYFDDVLAPTQEIERSLVESVATYRSFIDERVLWIQSAERISISTISDSWDAMEWLIAPSQWQAVRDIFVTEVQRRSVWYAMLWTGALVLFGLRRYLRLLLHRTSERARHRLQSRFSDTVIALFCTVARAASLAAPLLLIALTFNRAAESTSLTIGLSSALYRAAWMTLILSFVFGMLRDNGLGDAHFRWRAQTRKLVRSQVAILGPAFVVLAVVVTLFVQQELSSYRDSVGRFCFVAAMIVMATVASRVFSPARGLPREHLSRFPNGWSSRLRYIWYGLLVMTPLALGLMALLGWTYTAEQFYLRVAWSFRWWLILLVIHAVLLRWLFLAQRDLALENARRKRDERRKALEAAADGDAEAMPPPIEDEELNIAAISAQTRTLLRNVVTMVILVGFAAIWSDVLPAFNVLREFTVWEQVVTATETVTAADGSTAVETATRIVPVTLANILLSLFVLIVTFIVARNIRGILSIAILQRLPMSASGRYALTSVLQYAVVIIGIIVSFNMIGIGWSTVQWLAAAITVGLGFGLQEIFANFVSGLILLFEQPIRIGDTITVGEINGTVTKIRMRATTVVDWDRRELVIPNKDFVTNRIINWTLSDPILRVTVPVGIAYGSDTALAEKLLYDVAKQCDFVVNEPAPRVTFDAFGSSSLDFKLRVFITSVENWLHVKHALHSAIDQAFRQAGIEISFPQRDLHIRSIDGRIMAPIPAGEKSISSPPA